MSDIHIRLASRQNRIVSYDGSTNALEQTSRTNNLRTTWWLQKTTTVTTKICYRLERQAIKLFIHIYPVLHPNRRL